jgi:hypothetical protein
MPTFTNGTRVSGLYKRPGRHHTRVDLHVEHVAIVDGNGYLIGIRMDGSNVGSLQAMRVDGFFMDTVEIGETDDNVALTNLWIGSGPHFGFVEAIDDGLEWRAEREGLVPLADVAVDAFEYVDGLFPYQGDPEEVDSA